MAALDGVSGWSAELQEKGFCTGTAVGGCATVAILRSDTNMGLAEKRGWREKGMAGNYCDTPGAGK